MSDNLKKISEGFFKAAPWFALIMVFGFTWSHAFFYIGLVGLLTCLSLSPTNYARLLATTRQPICLLALALFIFIAVGVTYTSASTDLALFDIKKYRKLLLIPILLTIFNDIKWIKKIFISYILGALFLIIPTILDGFGIITYFDINILNYRDDSYSNLSLVYWRNHIVHGFHASILYIASVIIAIHNKKLRILFIVIAGILLVDIIFFINARTALIATLSVSILLATYYIKSNSLILLIVACMILTIILTYNFSEKLENRVNSITTEATEYFNKNNINSSGGNRLHYWLMSIKLYQNAPILGNGPGTFRQALDNKDNLLNNQPHRHAHNEYLTLASQHGIVGLILFFALVFQTYKNAISSKSYLTKDIISFSLLIFLINALTDSSLHNESEGWTFIILTCLSSIHRQDQIRII